MTLMTYRALFTVLTVGALAVSLTACTGGDDESPSPTVSTFSPSSTASPDAPDTGEQTDPPVGTGEGSVETPVAVPSSEADGWTDARAYDACRNEATRSQGADYTWNDRSSQVLVMSSAGRTMDVAGVYTGGDVGVANVVYRCVVDGTPSAPQLSGSVVR